MLYYIDHIEEARDMFKLTAHLFHLDTDTHDHALRMHASMLKVLGARASRDDTYVSVRFHRMCPIIKQMHAGA